MEAFHGDQRGVVPEKSVNVSQLTERRRQGAYISGCEDERNLQI